MRAPESGVAITGSSSPLASRPSRGSQSVHSQQHASCWVDRAFTLCLLIAANPRLTVVRHAPYAAL